MIEQLELPTASRQHPAPVTDEFANRIIDTLSEQAHAGQRWTTGKELCKFLGLVDCENTRRKFRQVAEANRHRLLTSNAGYCVIESATRDELSHAANWFRAQSRKMLAASVVYENYLHKGNNP